MLNSELLRSSFDLVATVAPDLTERFYANLFARYPQLRPMFSSNIKSQADMLTRALVAVLDHLEDAPWLTQTLGGMGKKHMTYGVTPEHFDMVGTALLETLAQVAGDAWTAELAQAWTDAYGAIAGLMMAGMEPTPVRARIEAPRPQLVA